MSSELEYWISIDRAREKALGQQPKRQKAFGERPTRKSKRPIRIDLPMSKADEQDEQPRTRICTLCGSKFSYSAKWRKYCDDCRRRSERQRWHKRMQNPYFAARERIRQRLKNRRKNGEEPTASA